MKMLIAAIILLSLAVQLQASTLTVLGTDSLGKQLIYDSALDITWYDYTHGSDIWQNQVNWASNLSVNFNGQSITGWRLPQTLPVNGSSYNYDYSSDGSTDHSYNISAPSSAYPGSTASEMAYLYYTVLGNNGYFDISGNPLLGSGVGVGLINTGPFTDLTGGLYWSGTEYAVRPSAAWVFYAYDGYQGSLDKENSQGMSALAVLPGRVEIAPVPEPSTMLLFGVGLSILGVMRFGRRVVDTLTLW